MEIGSVDMALVSTQMATQQVHGQVQTAVMKKSMDAHSEIAQQLIQDLAAMAPTSSKVDISV